MFCRHTASAPITLAWGWGLLNIFVDRETKIVCFFVPLSELLSLSFGWLTIYDESSFCSALDARKTQGTSRFQRGRTALSRGNKEQTVVADTHLILKQSQHHETHSAHMYRLHSLFDNYPRLCGSILQPLRHILHLPSAVLRCGCT